MIYRSFVALVIIFWGVMWTLLIRNELWPQESHLREVPVDLVLRQMFVHKQSSHLFISQGQEQLGHIRITPHVEESTGQQHLEISGTLQMALPGGGLQRFFWESQLRLNAELSVVGSTGTFTSRTGAHQAAPPTRAEWSLDLPAKQGTYRLAAGDLTLDEGKLSLDEQGLRQQITHWGVDPQLLASLPGGGAAPKVEVKSRRARMKVHGEEIDIFAVTLLVNEQTLLEAHFSELGQILDADTLIGWKLRAE